MSSRKTILVILLVIINVMAALYTKASINPMNSAQISTVNAGTIHGPAAVCTNQSTVVYFVDAIPGVINYAWTLPAGATVVSGQGTSSITIDFGSFNSNLKLFFRFYWKILFNRITLSV